MDEMHGSGDSDADAHGDDSDADEECGEEAVVDGATKIGRRRQIIGILDRKSTRLNSSHSGESRMPSSA